MSHFSKAYSTYDMNLLKTRILTKDDYHIIVNRTYRSFNIDSKVVCFYNGIDWNVVLLEDMSAYPVLYFDFWSEKDNVTYENSLVVCPLTMRSMIYKGKIRITDVINDRLYLLNTDTDDEFFMELPYTGHFDAEGKVKKIKSHVKRFEVKILVLRDAFMFLIDPKFIVVNVRERSLIRESYINDRFTYNGYPIYTVFHPKTLVHVVQYYSRKTENYKYLVLIGKDIDKDRATGYSFKTSGIWSFIEQHREEFIEKRAYIYPMFWFMVDRLYKDAQLIVIT